MSDLKQQGAQQWLASPDGGVICFYTWFPDDAVTPRGIVQVVHGTCDHGRRYRQLGERV